MFDLHTLAWPVDRLGDLLLSLAKVSNLSPHQVATPIPPVGLVADEAALERWLATAVANLGFEADPIRIAYDDLDEFLPTAGPALFRINAPDGQPRFLALVKSRRKALSILTPDHQIQRVPQEAVRTLLSAELEAPLLSEIDQILTETAVPRRNRAQARRFLLQEQLASVAIDGCWTFDLSPGSSFAGQLRRAGLLRHTIIFLLTYALQHFLFLFSWWVIGRAVFQGRVEFSWLIAWALILISLLPLRLLNTWLQGIVAVNLGGLLQKRLLFGAMRLHPDEIRHEGAGHLIGRIFEGEAIETLSLNGGIQGVAAIIELIMAGWVLALGAGGGFHALLLLVWMALIAAVLFRFYQHRHRWTEKRRDLTHYLVEVMVGHRTRLAQTLRQHWHRGEDEELTEYVKELDQVDRTAVVLEALISHGWLVVGLAGLAPAFISGSSTPVTLAISLGGVLSADLAFRKFAFGLINQLLAAIIAWDQIAPLFKAAARPELPGTPDAIVPANGARPLATPVLDAHNVTYRYTPQGDSVLHHCNLHIRSGDRILVEGPSGGGKSTLAALLTGLRQPNSGLLLWQGLDQVTLGAAGWRQRVVFAPQFHENHLLGSTFMFNLLMGRRWPPRPEDVHLAQELCQELGLGDVLARMPAGMLQTIGETGWQLSHGERSRLYIARALLQGADLIILDESFAALDPQNLQRAMQCVLERAPTLMVIAHP